MAFKFVLSLLLTYLLFVTSLKAADSAKVKCVMCINYMNMCKYLSAEVECDYCVTISSKGVNGTAGNAFYQGCSEDIMPVPEFLQSNNNFVLKLEKAADILFCKTGNECNKQGDTYTKTYNAADKFGSEAAQ
ncbi:hypothetical protein M3Y97_01124400 [Aphelenchoides bicaudatus]|nr:hypothetical protein M3Y97_01124400 [Aphelenchoides bicaudatus]